MKKVIWLLVMLSVCSISYAESMTFITVLSSAVGTFNKLEAVDPKEPAEGKQVVNFCTSIGTEGKVELKGTKAAKLNTVALADTTTLGRTGKGKYSLTEIKLNQGGNIKGGRLFGNDFTVNNAASGKADNLYGNELTVAGAKTDDLTVTNESFIEKKDQKRELIENPPDMVWSNEYQDDTACGGTSGTCKQQYLLKQKGTGSSSGPTVPTEPDPGDGKIMCIVAVDWDPTDVRTDCGGVSGLWQPGSSSKKTCRLGDACNCTVGEEVLVEGQAYDCKVYSPKSSECYNQTIKKGEWIGTCGRTTPAACRNVSLPGEVSRSDCTSPISSGGDAGLQPNPGPGGKLSDL